MEDYLSKSKITEETLVNSLAKELDDGSNVLEKYISNEDIVKRKAVS